MPNTTINNQWETFELSTGEPKLLNTFSLRFDTLIIRKVKVIDEDFNKLSFPIKITEQIGSVTKISHFHALSFHTNTRPGAETDVDCNFPIKGCSNTTLELISVFNQSGTFLIFYSEPEDLIIIEVIEQVGGVNFQLPLESYHKIKHKFPNSRIARNIFISYSTLSDFQSLHGSVGIHVIQGLIGLTEREVLNFTYDFINPRTMQKVDITI